MSEIKISTPLLKEQIKNLKVGDRVLITGDIYIARDAAHKRLYDTLSKGDSIPFDINNQIIYYAGPCPAKPGTVIGSCGPTTSGRMDRYTPILLKNGLTGMIGKGERNSEVIDSVKKNGCAYFVTVGGLGALLSKKIKRQTVIAYDDLGTEALRKVYVEDFPAILSIKKGDFKNESN